MKRHLSKSGRRKGAAFRTPRKFIELRWKSVKKIKSRFSKKYKNI